MVCLDDANVSFGSTLVDPLRNLSLTTHAPVSPSPASTLPVADDVPRTRSAPGEFLHFVSISVIRSSAILHATVPWIFLSFFISFCVLASLSDSSPSLDSSLWNETLASDRTLLVISSSGVTLLRPAICCRCYSPCGRCEIREAFPLSPIPDRLRAAESSATVVPPPATASSLSPRAGRFANNGKRLLNFHSSD